MKNAKDQTLKLEQESRKMEDRLRELKMAMSKEKEQREYAIKYRSTIKENITNVPSPHGFMLLHTIYNFINLIDTQ